MASAALIGALRERRGVTAALMIAATLGGLLAGCAATSTADLTVWVAGDCNMVLPDTPPALESDVFSAAQQRVTLAAAINETVACQIVLSTEHAAAGPFDLRVSDLSGASGTLTAADSITLYRVHTVRVENFRSWYPDHAARPAIGTDFPDILVPWQAPHGGGPISLRRDRNELIWLDLRVPPTTEPGTYTGRIQLLSPSAPQQPREMTIALQVMPVAIPDERGLPLICRIDPRDLLSEHLRWPASTAEDTIVLPSEPTHNEAARLLDATMQLFHAHRADPVLWACFPKYRPATDREVDVSWGDYDALVGGWIDGSAYPDRVATACWPLPASVDYPSAQRNGGIDSPRYAAALGGYLRACVAHFEERGWLERAIVR
ncbi:MAG: hypothetical protein JXO22_09905, partial [Phycisphaerae bacterium]|nr:hypothetical protein [Phycisphaerae bacterium]